MDYVKIIKNSSKLYKKIKSFTEKNDDIYYYYDSEKNTITDTNKINKKEKPRPFEVFISDKADIIYDIYIPLSKTLKERLLKGVKEIVSEKMTINIKKLFKSNKNKVLEDDLDFEIKDIEKQVKKHYWILEKYITDYVSELNDSLKLT